MLLGSKIVSCGIPKFFGLSLVSRFQLQRTNSDCEFAREMLLRVAKEAIGEYLVEAQTSWKVMSEYYQGANAMLEPTVRLVVNAGSLEFSVSYVVDYMKRTAMQDQLFTTIVQEVANSNGRLAWATSGTTILNQPQTPAAVVAHPSSSTLAAGHTAGSR